MNSLYEVGEKVLEDVVRTLDYPSVDAINEDVEKIKEWMETQHHLPEIMDDKKIQNFLIMNKGSVQRSKEKIDYYYTVRSKLPEIFDSCHPKLPYMEHTLKSSYFLPSPKMTKEMYRVFFYKVRDKSLAENFNPVHGVRYLVAVQEIRLLEDVAYGDIFVIDAKDLSLRAALNITPNILFKALVIIYKKVFSNRLKAVYVLNTPSYMEKVLVLFKAVMKPKLYDRIHFCHDYNFLIEKLGKEVVPEDYGGGGLSLNETQELLVQKFKEYEAYFDKMENLRVNEDLRPEELKDDDVMGIYGNFKKLDID